MSLAGIPVIIREWVKKIVILAGGMTVNRMILGPSIQVSFAGIPVIISEWVKNFVILADGMDRGVSQSTE
jgi:hypothetical protein